MTIKEIKSNIYWVGVKDWNRRLFDALVPLPQGTTYNSYLIKGDEKTVLIDTVNPGFENELKNNIIRRIRLCCNEPCGTRPCRSTPICIQRE